MIPLNGRDPVKLCLMPVQQMPTNVIALSSKPRTDGLFTHLNGGSGSKKSTGKSLSFVSNMYWRSSLGILKFIGSNPHLLERRGLLNAQPSVPGVFSRPLFL